MRKLKANMAATLGMTLGLSAFLPLRAEIEGAPSIVGGKAISITEAPWQLLFEPTGSMCGAVWIGGRWALSAAHCVEKAVASTSFVYAGITKASEAKNSNRLAIKRIIPKPEFPESWQDISILELAADITSPLAKPIRYATAADVTDGSTNAGVECFATGWGGTDRNVSFPDSLQGVLSKVKSLETYMINWAGQGGTANVGSCQGDSGGPLAVKDKSGAWIVAGISSYITSFCGDPKAAAGYSRVSAFADWIKANTGISTETLDWRASGFSTPVEFHRNTFTLAKSGNLEILILDFRGVAVTRVREHYNAGQHAIPMEGLVRGEYVLDIIGDAGRFHNRFANLR